MHYFHSVLSQVPKLNHCNMVIIELKTEDACLIQCITHTQAAIIQDKITRLLGDIILSFRKKHGSESGNHAKR